MTNRVTLITPPDIFENANKSVLVVDLSSEEQDTVSAWLGEFQGNFDINIYFYHGENDISWLLHAVNRAEYVYLNIDNHSEIGHMLTSYLLSKPNVWYNTQDVNIKSIYSHINQRYVKSVKEFFEKALNEN